MEPSALVAALGSVLPVLLLSALVGLVGAVVAGLALLRGRANPLLVAAPVAIPLVAAEIAAALAVGGMAGDPGRSVAVAVGVRLVALLFALPGAAVVALFAAVAGGRGPVRRWRDAVPVLILALVTAGVTLAGGLAVDDWLYPLLRAALYAVMGVALAAAQLGGDERGGTHPEAAAASGAVFALVVAAGELSARALETVFLLAVLPSVAPVDRAAYVDLSMTDVIGPSAPWHDAALAVGWVTAVVAVALAGRSGRAASWAALPWVVLATSLGRVGTIDARVLHGVAPLLGLP